MTDEEHRLRETAKSLAERVSATLDHAVEHHAHELGIDPKWVVTEFVYQATQRAREMSDQAGKTKS